MVFEYFYAPLVPGILLVTLNANTYGEPEKFAEMLEKRLEEKLGEDPSFRYESLIKLKRSKLAGRREGSWCAGLIIRHYLEEEKVAEFLKEKRFRLADRDRAVLLIILAPEDFWGSACKNLCKC